MLNSKSKYIGQVYNAYWEVIDCKMVDNNHQVYILENQCNKMQLYLYSSAMSNVAKGKTDVYKIMKVRRKKHINWQYASIKL